MTTIKILDLRSVDSIQSEDLLDVVSDSITRAIKARGNYPHKATLGSSWSI